MIRQIGALTANEALAPNDWLAVSRRGDAAIKDWIKRQLERSRCVVVLIGRETASRPWVRYEIEEGWRRGLGVVGIRIERLLDARGRPDVKGPNPFDSIEVGFFGKRLSRIVTTHDSRFHGSKLVYDDIRRNIESWVVDAIRVREQW